MTNMNVEIPRSQRAWPVSYFVDLVGQRIPFGLRGGMVQTATLQAVAETATGLQLTFADDALPE